MVIAVSLLLDPISLFAQQQLQPLWQHIWEFGQDDPMFIVPAARDNHVVVDPITGLVHCTVDDQLSTYSDRAELIYTFSPDGTDLTSDPPPLVGLQSPVIEPLINSYSTRDLKIHNGRVLASQLLRGSTYNFNNHVVCDGPQGSPWVTSYHLGDAGPDLFGFHSVAMDDQYVVLAGPPLMVFDANGWFQWKSDQSGLRAFLHGDIIYTATEGEIRRFQLVDGTPLSPFSTTQSSFMPMTFNASNIYWAEVFSGSLNATSLSLEGDPVWDIQIPVDPTYTVRTIAMDANGRLWCVLNSYDANVPDIVVRIEMDGSSFTSYFYGHRMNEIATDGDRIYITGQLDQTTSETYLIGVDASLPTSIAGVEGGQDFNIWPNPAQDILNVGPARVDWTHATICDACGRIIRTFARTDLTSIDVHDLEQGAYFLSFHGNGVAEGLPFMITR